MEQYQNQYNNQIEEQEIDLVELAQRMWLNKGFIIKVTSVFIVLGLLVALFSSRYLLPRVMWYRRFQIRQVHRR
jgi:LPS O-antigen subunit length determinant protein (WzzB/FepE family)